MKTITRAHFPRLAAVLAAPSVIGCSSGSSVIGPAPTGVNAATVVIESHAKTPRPPFAFSASDARFLDEIQHATFTYFWEAVSPETGMVYDRTSSDVISVAGVGFQLAALPIGIERGWITREQGHARARQIIDALQNEPSNRKAGLFYHFINPHDASARRVGRELVVSTVDSALLFSGMLVAGKYFGEDIRRDTDRLWAEADWSFFLADPGDDAPDGRFISLGWKPHADDAPTGDGELLPYYWIDSGDEHRLVTLLGVCAPNPDHRVSPEVYWSLRRMVGWHPGQGHIVWFPYSGALFTSFFAHLFIDSTAFGPDAPGDHAQAHRARVDWWENSRRVVHLHRDRAIENPLGLPTLGPDAWGFSASDGPDGYLVSGQFPQPVAMLEAAPGKDFATYPPQVEWGGGVIAPYAPGTAIMFEPDLAVRALRFAHAAKAPNNGPGVWRDTEPRAWGFADAFRLDREGRVDWVAEDYVAISQGPLIIGIENARTGMIWELLMSHPSIESGLERLDLDADR